MAMAQDDLIDAANLGEAAREFIESDLGKTLLARAEQEIIAALQGLGEVDPTDTKAITALQNRAAMGRMFAQWLNEIMQIGDEAVTVWKQQND